jgi:hypothetical protein
MEYFWNSNCTLKKLFRVICAAEQRGVYHTRSGVATGRGWLVDELPSALGYSLICHVRPMESRASIGRVVSPPVFGLQSKIQAQ